LVLKDIKSHGEDKNNHWILEEVRGSQEGKPPERVAYGPGNNNKKNVPRELEQPDLREKSAFVLKEYDTDLGQYYNKTDKYEEYKSKVFPIKNSTGAKMMGSELLLLMCASFVLLPQPEPPPPEPPPEPPPPEPPPPERLEVLTP
jgi:hypothetical protein